MSFENNIKKMFTEFDEGQKDWFRFELPKYLGEWVVGGFNGKQLTRNPTLIEDYLKREISLSYVPKKKDTLDNLLMSLWCIRKCHGPIHAPKLYRLTKINDLSDSAENVRISATNSLKPITSWSSTENVVVHDRDPTERDFILRLDSVEPKYVLGTIDIVFEFVRLVLKNAKLLGLDEARVKVSKRMTAKKEWETTQRHVRGFLDEKEYLIYLHPGEEIKAVIHKRLPAPVEEPKARAAIKTKKQKLQAKKIKVNLEKEPNPFEGPGLKGLSPKEQMKVVRQAYLKEKKKPDSNAERLDAMKRQWLDMRDYADSHKIDV